MLTIHPIDTIVSDPEIRKGQPIIVGTHIRVVDVVAAYLYRGLSPEDIAINYRLDMGQVHATLAYYYQHKAEIDNLIQSDSEEVNQLLAQFESQGKLIRVE